MKRWNLKRIHLRWALIFPIGVALVAVCYVYVDVPLARFAHRHDLRQYPIFHGLQMLSDGLVLLAPVALLAVGWRRYRGRTAPLDRVALQATLGVLGVSLLKYPLKFAFGRTWPATFYENNPSLLYDGVYGFHLFQGGVAYSAFPSGHAAVATVVAAVLWHSYPRYRILAVLLWLAVAVGLLGAYYHFAGDVLGGTLLGIFVAALVIRFGARAPVKEPENPV